LGGDLLGLFTREASPYIIIDDLLSGMLIQHGDFSSSGWGVGFVSKIGECCSDVLGQSFPVSLLVDTQLEDDGFSELKIKVDYFPLFRTI